MACAPAFAGVPCPAVFGARGSFFPPLGFFVPPSHAYAAALSRAGVACAPAFAGVPCPAVFGARGSFFPPLGRFVSPSHACAAARSRADAP
ncbi:hypothetical protein [Sorangium sp. So ce204]|uniref:hypothetical protein n=1 Tax=Sorangium sp. So ce204 TaxID=3133288 RepID=UPI003F5DA37E